MQILFLDIETFSSYNLLEVGSRKYVEAPDFEILTTSYAYDQGEIKTIDHTYQPFPSSLLRDLYNPNVIKVAHNAFFEVNCFNVFLQRAGYQTLDITQWRDTMIMAYYLTLPGNLDSLGKVLKIKDKKLGTGKYLISYFCVPCKPTTSNGQRTRNLPKHDMDKWLQFIKYNQVDVAAEREIYYLLEPFSPPPFVWQEWWLDYTINARGVGLDETLINNALELADAVMDELRNDLKDLTNIDNPKSNAQFRDWISETEGRTCDSVAKTSTFIPETDEVKEAMSLRNQLSKSSLSKYETMLGCRCSNGRGYHFLQFYGASRTGRWAGRMIQVQNLPRSYLSDSDLEFARHSLIQANYEGLRLFFDNITDLLSQLIRTAIIPSKGHKFIVADYSAIEARVIAWLADEEWRMNVFATHGKIYEASASKIYNVPIEDIKKGSDYRSKGKIAELACGYGGGVGAIKRFDPNIDLTDKELLALIHDWRKASPNIVRLWYAMNENALAAVKFGLNRDVKHGVSFYYDAKKLYMKLPSGRSLVYLEPYLRETIHHTEELVYSGVEDGKWIADVKTYGGKLTENAVQAIARDCLSFAIINLEKAGYKVVMHVHDEVIIEATPDQHLEDVLAIMALPIPWAKGLKLRAEGFESTYYRKD